MGAPTWILGRLAPLRPDPTADARGAADSRQRQQPRPGGYSSSTRAITRAGDASPPSIGIGKAPIVQRRVPTSAS
jgi:hypothetical protein